MEASDGSIGKIRPKYCISKYYLKALYCEMINLTIHDKNVLTYIYSKEVKSSEGQNENKTLILTSFLMIFNLK